MSQAYPYVKKLILKERAALKRVTSYGNQILCPRHNCSWIGKLTSLPHHFYNKHAKHTFRTSKLQIKIKKYEFRDGLYMLVIKTMPLFLRLRYDGTNLYHSVCYPSFKMNFRYKHYKLILNNPEVNKSITFEGNPCFGYSKNKAYGLALNNFLENLDHPDCIEVKVVINVNEFINRLRSSKEPSLLESSLYGCFRPECNSTKPSITEPYTCTECSFEGSLVDTSAHYQEEHKYEMLPETVKIIVNFNEPIKHKYLLIRGSKIFPIIYQLNADLLRFYAIEDYLAEIEGELYLEHEHCKIRSKTLEIRKEGLRRDELPKCFQFRGPLMLTSTVL